MLRHWLCEQSIINQIPYAIWAYQFKNICINIWKQGIHRTTSPPAYGQPIHAPTAWKLFRITWPMYLPCTVAQEQTMCVQHCIQLTSFIPSKSTFPFLKDDYWKFDLENPRSRFWVRSKFNLTARFQHPIDSHPLGFTSIHPIIPMIESFKFDLKNPRSKS